MDILYINLIYLGLDFTQHVIWAQLHKNKSKGNVSIQNRSFVNYLQWVLR